MKECTSKNRKVEFHEYTTSFHQSKSVKHAGRVRGAEMAIFTVAGYLMEERRKWPVMLPHEDNIINKLGIFPNKLII